MTPAEMCVLFSGDVLAFILVWFTNIAEGEQGGRRTKKVPDVPQAKALNASIPATREKLTEEHFTWNVGTFFGMKHA
jgi:hypothetical protein